MFSSLCLQILAISQQLNNLSRIKLTSLKKINLIFSLLFIPIIIYSQTLGLCGYTPNTPGDGCSFVLNQSYSAGDRLYISGSDYSDADNRPEIPVGAQDATLEYIFAENKSIGEVITVMETGSNVFTVSCSSGSNCGSINAIIGSANWGIANQEPITIFTDSDEDGDPSTGTIEVLSFVSSVDYTGDLPTSDWPNAVIITGLPAGATYEFKASLRSGAVIKSTLESTSNWELVSFGSPFSTTTFSNIALPVELGTFQVRQINDDIKLVWTTISEINNAGFEIERSNNLETWQTIGFELGHGTTTEEHTYEFIDTRPNLGINYYRLKQIDFDQKFEYSDIVTIDYKGELKNDEISIYPNPVQNQLFIENATGVATIYNVIGQPVRQFVIAANTNRFTLNTVSLISGNYILQVTTNKGMRQTKRFIKSN